jgi:hypothetical protein
LDSNFQDELQNEQVEANIKSVIRNKQRFSSTNTPKNLQSLMDKQIFFCVMNRPLGVVMLQGKKM